MTEAFWNHQNSGEELSGGKRSAGARREYKDEKLYKKRFAGACPDHEGAVQRNFAGM